MTGIEFKNIFEENFDSLRAYIYYKSTDEELATDINRANIKYANLRRVDTNTSETVNIQTETVPFTPTLFLKLKI